MMFRIVSGIIYQLKDIYKYQHFQSSIHLHHMYAEYINNVPCTYMNINVHKLFTMRRRISISLQKCQ